MRKARLIIGRTALGILTLAGGAAAAEAAQANGRGAASAAGDLSTRSVAEGLAGEWDGQIAVRAEDGSLSTSWVGMCARLAADGERLELYYEGFAFGRPVEGAMLLSFADRREALSIRDRAAGVRVNCSPTADASSGGEAGNSLSMQGNSPEGAEDIRAVFSRDEHGAWTIDCQRRQSDGQWSSLLLLNVSRLEEGQRSAAAANFAGSADLVELRSEHVTAAVDDQ